MLHGISTLARIPRAETQYATHPNRNYAPYAHLDYTSRHCIPVVGPGILQSIQLSRGCVPLICGVRMPDEVP